MQLPLQVTFRHMEPSEVIETNVRKKAEKLDRFYDQIMSCRVVVEAPHKHHNKGNIYHVRIDVTVPDGELVVSRDPELHKEYADVYVAVRDAFDSMVRQLEDYVRKRKQKVKTHQIEPHGRISSLNIKEGYGNIETSDGREVYFHRNSVLEADFEKLEIGTEVRFAEERGDMGPQASTVKVIGKHHLVD